MTTDLKPLPKLLPVKGINIGTVAAGIRYRNRPDLVVIEAAKGSNCAAVFTRNAFCAAPIVVARRHLSEGSPYLLLINAGNANAGTGDQGLMDAQACCTTLADLSGVDSNAVLPFSTGVIGERLPVSIIQAALPLAWEARSSTGWLTAAQAIMTTDTVLKGLSRELIFQGRLVTITGIAKGSGMIWPDMATMLAFLATDAQIPKALLQRCLTKAVEESFNCITVDGDTSTNDACVLLATGKSGISIENTDSVDFITFQQTVTEICQYLAQAIIRDGEGATKFITVRVTGGANIQECKQVAYNIAHSPLVKTAFFASDPNWGRILAAVGRSNILGLTLDRISLYLSEVCVVSNGVIHPDYSEDRGHAVMQRGEITVEVNLGRGEAEIQIWTCDFSYDYVKINAEYRS
ncbi:arginine biosynthesis bifunctional protein ArgJ [Candidatus Nitrosoglobus terrae]|uniref:Arginine biosynthesis bifunctional protein ArgJ n=1 Tax=Candidatus Nitrosoglobus terrae TaxID=1630141 RepID=A0A1Q2SKG1_9GAMM|nr:bifunctional glutamate N-acetyltransferase/amino-acid acetyltransferase ArgJ [Candidatus Nitrosoglobus terrae]BAW79608.1 arginine biosynthesis bifunctional protein ArgJ [Candidatus Nitrosoglobus terrae]